MAADLRAYKTLLTERLLAPPKVADVRSNVSPRRFEADVPPPLPNP